MTSYCNEVFKTLAAAEAFRASLGDADEGEHYEIETNGKTFIVVLFAGSDRLMAI